MQVGSYSVLMCSIHALNLKKEAVLSSETLVNYQNIFQNFPVTALNVVSLLGATAVPPRQMSILNTQRRENIKYCISAASLRCSLAILLLNRNHIEENDSRKL